MTTNPLRELDEALHEGSLVAVIGAGVSRTAGYPLWGALIDRLHEKAESLMPGAKQGGSREKRWIRATPSYVQQLRAMDDVLWRAEEYRRLFDEVDPTIFQDLIRDTFKPRRKPPRSALIDAVVRLPFRHVLNTNYDRSLQDAYAAVDPDRRVAEWYIRAELQGFLGHAWGASSERYLVYLHGVYSRPESVVLSERDYVDRYMANDDASKKLFALFITNRMVFIGFSLTDPELVYLLRVAHAHLGGARPRHFAFLPRQKGWTTDVEEATRSTYRGKYGVEPIFYDAPNHNHGALVKMLRGLDPRNGREREMLMASPAAAENRDDPHKGRFGGAWRANGLSLRAAVNEDAEDPGWFHIEMWVGADPGRLFDGKVTFHLHPTFRPAVQAVKVRKGRARIERWAYGAFTVGAVADDGTTLELDLAQDVPGAPPLFTSR